MKEELDQAESFKILQNAADGLRGIPDIHNKKDPVVKKWDEAKAAVPKKHRKAFYEKAYEESRNDKEWQRERLYEKEIRPNTKTVHFWLGEGVVKEKRLLNEKEKIEECALETHDNSYIVQNIGVPETIDIDYSEIKDLLSPKYGGELMPYKDGFLIVRDDNPKSYHHIDLSDYTTNPKTEARLLFQTLILTYNTHYYLRSERAQKIKKNINNINFYIVFRRAYKNKAFKITFKDNKYLKHIINLFNNFHSEPQKLVTSIAANMPSSFMENYVDSLGVLERYELVADTPNQKSDGSILSVESMKEACLNISKQRVLKAGYYFSMISKIITFVATIHGILKQEKVDSLGDFGNSIMKIFKGIDAANFKSIMDKTLEALNTSTIETKDLISFAERYICQERYIEEKDKIDLPEMNRRFFNIFTCYNHTEKGTSLPITGKINVDKATDIDCLHYWNYINNFNLVNGCLAKDDFPLLLDDGKVFNENELYKHVHEVKLSIGQSPFRSPNETLDFDSETKSKISEILTEAMDQTTGLLIPYNACVELKDDPVFKYIRFIEYEKYIAIFVHDENNRFISELFVKGEKEFRYWMFNSGQVFDTKIAESSKLIYLKIATCIRDWKVLIERDSTMQYRGCRVPTGVKSSTRRYIYLPRVTYKRSETREQRSREKIFFNESRKFSGDRRAHRRKLPSGMKASKTQLILAKDVNLYIPEGYTFVKKSIWGKIKMSQREIKYRNTSLNGLFYASDAEVKKVKEIHELSPAGFEEYSEKYVAKLGWEVRKRNNYDGGIDIRALRDTKEGVEQLVAQCKHWKKPIGPDVLRELVGSATDEESEYKKVLMVITSSKFTAGAVDYADRNDIILVDGDEFLK